jgi:hypothetical protein
MKIWTRALLAMAMLSTAPFALAAQEEEGGGGGKEEDGCPSAGVFECGTYWTQHKAVGPGGGRKFTHTACTGCSSGDPNDCHPMCNANRGDEVMYIALTDATFKGRIQDIIALAPIARRYVSYNTSRGTIQVRACDGESVIANFKVSREVGQAYVVAMARLDGRAVAMAKLAGMQKSIPRFADILPKVAQTYASLSEQMSVQAALFH